MARNIFKSVSRQVHGNDDDDNEKLRFLMKKAPYNKEYLKKALM